MYRTPADQISPSVRIIEAVANLKGCDPLDLPPLQHVVDADALDAIIADDKSIEIEFQYANTKVSLCADGWLHIETDTIE